MTEIASISMGAITAMPLRMPTSWIPMMTALAMPAIPTMMGMVRPMAPTIVVWYRMTTKSIPMAIEWAMPAMPMTMVMVYPMSWNPNLVAIPFEWIAMVMVSKTVMA